MREYIRRNLHYENLGHKLQLKKKILLGAYNVQDRELMRMISSFLQGEHSRHSINMNKRVDLTGKVSLEFFYYFYIVSFSSLT